MTRSRPIRQPAYAELVIRVTPRAGRNELLWGADGALTARVTAPPTEGQANAALTELVAKRLNVPKSSVTISSGGHSRTKRVRVDGMTSAEIEAALSSV